MSVTINVQKPVAKRVDVRTSTIFAPPAATTEEMEAGVEAEARAMSPKHVAEAIAAQAAAGLGTAAFTDSSAYATALQGADERVPTAAGLTTKFGTTVKGLPVDGDKFAMLDSEELFIPKYVLWSVVKSTLKTYFDGLYSGTGHSHAMPSAADVGAAAASHTHGDVTSDGKIGAIADLPVKTGPNGALGVGTFGTGAKEFAEGNDKRLALGADINRHGFLNTTETSIGFSGTLFTLTAAGEWSYYRSGAKCTITGSKTVNLNTAPNWSNLAGLYFIYINGADGTLTCSEVNTPWSLLDAKVPAASVWYDPGNTPTYWLADERHTALFDQRLQYYVHSVFGAKLLGAPTLSGHSIDSDANVSKTFAISACTLLDQDMIFNIASMADPNGTSTDYVVFHRTAPSVWTWKLSAMPFPYNIGNANNKIQYDNGSGVMTDCSGTGPGVDMRWVNSYLLVTNTSGAARFAIVPGRAQFTTLANAQVEDVSAWTWTGFGIDESVICYRLTWVCRGGGNAGQCEMDVAPKVLNLSTVTNVSSGAGTDHNTLSNIQGGTTDQRNHLSDLELAAATAVQSAAIPSIRALGAGSDNAAPGNHGHAGVYQPAAAALSSAQPAGSASIRDLGYRPDNAAPGDKVLTRMIVSNAFDEMEVQVTFGEMRVEDTLVNGRLSFSTAHTGGDEGVQFNGSYWRLYKGPIEWLSNDSPATPDLVGSWGPLSYASYTQFPIVTAGSSILDHQLASPALKAEQDASIASIRKLGTGVKDAAPGLHTHTDLANLALAFAIAL